MRPPDAVAATAVLKNLRVPKRLVSVLEGESLVNDSSGLVAYQFAIAAVMTGTFSSPSAGTQFLRMSIGGIALGLAVGFAITHLHRQLRDPAVEITPRSSHPIWPICLRRSWDSPSALGGDSRTLHRPPLLGGLHARKLITGSGHLALPRISAQRNGVHPHRVAISSIMEGLEHIPLWKLILAGTSISVVIILVRFLWIFPLAAIERRILRRTNDEKSACRKGLSLRRPGCRHARSGSRWRRRWRSPLDRGRQRISRPAHYPLLTFFVIFVTLVLQGLLASWLARKLNVEEADHEYQTEGQARITPCRSSSPKSPASSNTPP